MSESDTLKFATDNPSEAPPKRQRSLQAIAKQKATVAARRERQAATVSAKTGLDDKAAREMERARRLAQAEARVTSQAIPEDDRDMVFQEIKVDIFNTKRQYVELTPSMCRVRNCPFDAAKEAGCAGWADAPIDQPMADGKSFGQRLTEMRDHHEATGHTVEAQESHIMKASEVNKRQWGAGNSVKGEFLKGAR